MFHGRWLSPVINFYFLSAFSETRPSGGLTDASERRRPRPDPSKVYFEGGIC